MSDELKPCPFCGGKAEWREEQDPRHPDEPWGLIAKHTENCFLSVFNNWEEMPTAWNTRAQQTTAEAVREACAKVADSWVAADYSEECNLMADSIAREIRDMPLPEAAIGNTIAEQKQHVTPISYLYQCYDGRTVFSLCQLGELAANEAWHETPLIKAPEGQSDE